MRSVRRLLVSLVAAACLVPLLATASAAAPATTTAPTAPSAPAAARAITYSVGTAGSVSTNVGAFAAHVRSTLDDPRGWSLGGSIDFREVQGPASLRILIAQPSVIGARAGCSSLYSCHVSGTVYINETRWNSGAPGWSGSLDAYRHYVVNHEVGHYLGLGHTSCPASGAPAPVMMQQTISTAPCVNRVWPLPSERQAVARRYGVAVRTGTYAFVQRAYDRLLRRPASEADAAALAARIDRGEVGRAQAVANIATSFEFDAVSGAVGRLYYAALGRTPDPSGVLHWTRTVQQGYDIRKVAGDFARGVEFRRRFGDLDDAGYVDRLYRNVLGRRADGPGKRYWVGQLRGGMTRGEALFYFSDSPENRERRNVDVDVALYYALVLDVRGDPGGVAYWTRLLEGGARRVDVLAVFIAQPQSKI